MRHRDARLNHIIENWTFANSAARTGLIGALPEDVGKIGFQQDDNTYWRLVDDSPVTWVPLGSSGGGSGSFVTPPVNSSSTGIAGQQAYDSTNFYQCVASNTWLRFFGAAVFGIFNRVFSSDGDTNGVFNFIGTLGLTNPFFNPQNVTSNPLIATASGILGTEEPISGLTDRAPGHVYVTNSGGNWIKFDLGVGRSLILTAYSYRSRTGFSGDFPTAWKLEASNDNVSWTLIDGPRSVSITTTNQWLTTAVTGQTIAYRYWRWTSTGGTTYFVFGETELYGTFKY
jgi:hypothetical protein